MRTTKKITLSAMIVALGAALMAIGGIVDVFDLSACAIASILVAFVHIEIGSPYNYLVWICTALATSIMFPGSMVWIEYLAIFGIYPILKAYIERTPRAFWIPIKLVYVNAIIWLLFLASELFLHEDFWGTDKLLVKIAIYVLLNVAFVLYDVFITVLIRFYLEKLRHRFKNFLK